MASVKMYYNIQSCPKCGKKLLKVQSGTVKIGSPFLDCKTCGITYITPLRVEWYKYPAKWVVFAMPLIVAAIMVVVGMIMGEPAVGVAGGIIVGLIFVITWTIPEVIRIFKSMKRMRDPDYLKRLCQANLISFEEYKRFSMKK